MTKIGLHIPYNRSDATHAALQVARYAAARGLDVEILPRGTPGPVHPHWDRHVVKADQVKYGEWVKTGFSHIVFTQADKPEQVFAARQAGARCYLICLWDELTQEVAPHLQTYDKVIFPTKAGVRLFQEKFGLTNVLWIPWDPGVPLTCDDRELDPDKLAFIWPLDNGQASRQDLTFIPFMARLVRENAELWLTVTYSNSLPVPGVKELRKLADAGQGRVELIKNMGWDKLQILLGRHDMTVWPTLIESVGLVGLCSVFMGTPVLAFDHPLVGETVRHGKNGILVPCNLQYNWAGVPHVAADHALFGEQLRQLIREPIRLEVLRGTVGYGLADRRGLFAKGWNALLA